MTEARALRLSVDASLLIGVVGIVWGLLVDSRIVLFDGVFTIFGTALSGLSLLASWAAGFEPDERRVEQNHRCGRRGGSRRGRRRLYVEVDFLVDAGEWDVAEEDRVRRSLISGLSSLELEIWANVELTTDPDLAR